MSDSVCPQDPNELATDQHRCIFFREPITGRPFPWDFHRVRKKISVKPHGSLTVNDSGTVYSMCLAGLGIAQLLELGADTYIASNQLIPLFPDWPDQRFPLYAYYPSRHHVPAKTRALLDFVTGLVGEKG
ncbi:substrate binding domain-containing protein [Ewingella americana]